MNYRHIFHAGNICDIVKHAALMLMLEHLRLKQTPFAMLDTHAGIGLYDLAAPRALKTGEAQSGILQLLSAPPIPELSSFYHRLQSLNPGWRPGGSEALRYYPGSPVLAALTMRPHDRLIACELHPDDAKDLRYNLHRFPHAHAHHRDGYEALRAFLPPPEKRGLVLIDPPFEQPDEFARLPDILRQVHQRWHQGAFMLWYPIKERPLIWRFHEALAATGIAKILCAEFVYQEESRSDRLNGSGLILINPPWQMDEKLGALCAALHQALQTQYQGVCVKWLSDDKAT